MNKPTIAIVGCAALSALVSGCSSNSQTASPSSTAVSSSAPASSTSTASATSTSAAAAPTDYTNLLVRGNDISNVFSPAEPPRQNPNGTPGAAVVFRNQDDTKRISDTVLILADAGAATTALNGSLASVGSTVTGGSPQPFPMVGGGQMVAGTSPDKSKAVTVLLFTEGKAFVTLEFDSAPNEPVPPEFAQTVAAQQDAAIKKKLAS